MVKGDPRTVKRFKTHHTSYPSPFPRPSNLGATTQHGHDLNALGQTNGEDVTHTRNGTLLSHKDREKERHLQQYAWA